MSVVDQIEDDIQSPHSYRELISILVDEVKRLEDCFAPVFERLKSEYHAPRTFGLFLCGNLLFSK
jgi:hypothetical protein